MACSASEIVEKVAIIEGHEKEQPTSVAQRCARIYAECNPKPGKSKRITKVLYFLYMF